MKDFRTLSVWEKSHAITLSIYKSTSSFPKEERYGLVRQMRRSASSIPSNIAEGCGRNTQSQFAHFLNIAFGSASELEYQIILSKDLSFINRDLCTEGMPVAQNLVSFHHRYAFGTNDREPQRDAFGKIRVFVVLDRATIE